MSNREDKKIGKYRITNKRLGSGQFATVYEGYDATDQTKVAIKVMERSKIEANEKLVRSLDLEVSMSTKLRHKNLVQAIALYKSKSSYFLILERCYGGDLKEFLEHGKLPEHVAKKFLRDMADGLKVLLENNIIHRDLKPANLLLDRKSTLSDVGTLKIADFGLAREILSGELAQTQLGSPNYMAPEIMDGKTYDSRADLFSVGVILYEMLYGRLPWIARSMYELRNMIHSIKPQFPETVDLAAIHLMKNLLQFDPQNRLNFEAFYSHPYLAQDPVLNSSDDLSLGAFQDNLFDFSYLEDANELIDRVEDKAKCAFYIAEAAHYMGNSLHGFSLFVKSMKLLLETIRTIPKPYSPRVAAVVTWMKSRYVAFEKKADVFKKQAMLDYICPEKTLFEYAIRIGTEAANDELMMQDTNRVIIYTRSKAIIDYLLEQGKDVETLTMYSQLFGARIKHLKSL